MSLITIDKVTKKYQQGQKTINAADGITLHVEEGEFIVIIGPSGSGKSTLLQLVGGLDRPTTGTISINKIETSKASERKLTRLRRTEIGFIFQSFNLIPTLTAIQNVEAAISKHSSFDKSRSEEMLKLVNLEHRMNHLPSLLSGGEQQRVAIARALVNDPKIILADEPTGNLDSKTGEEIMRLLRDLNQKQGKTIILITHSEYVQKFADRVLKIRDGKIVN
ncbi:MAG TPA: ABC transporter ATP-binding protein [bacterium]|nr:ABC transporter ATP-binding protein [bacterium]